jgi:hypothetical protein
MRDVEGIVSPNHMDTENKWNVTVEFSFPVDQYDLQQIFDDDTELDYMHRAWERFRPVLEDLVKESRVSSYRLREAPHRLGVKL